jgi:hypothetical protein
MSRAVAGVQLSGTERAQLEEQRRLERAKEEQLTHLLMVSGLPRALTKAAEELLARKSEELARTQA